MNKPSALQLLASESKRLGLRHGEDAKSFRERNPEGARQLAELLRQHNEELVKSISGLVR